MRNEGTWRENYEKCMRNTNSKNISHSGILLIILHLATRLWEYEKWKQKTDSSSNLVVKLVEKIIIW